MRPAPWDALLNRDDPDSLLYYLWLYGSEEGIDRFFAQPERSQEVELAEHAQQVKRVEAVVPLIHAYWMPQRLKELRGQTIRSEGPKIGRNDPCPCGSGKKYKKCHGAAA